MVRSILAAWSAGMKRPATQLDIGAPGISTREVMVQLMKTAMVMTKVTALPMPTAMSTWRETPTKGQMPTK